MFRVRVPVHARSQRCRGIIISFCAKYVAQVTICDRDVKRSHARYADMLGLSICDWWSGAVAFVSARTRRKSPLTALSFEVEPSAVDDFAGSVDGFAVGPVRDNRANAATGQSSARTRPLLQIAKFERRSSGCFWGAAINANGRPTARRSPAHPREKRGVW